MTDDTEFTLDIGTDSIDSLTDVDEPLETALMIASDLPTRALSLAGGGLLLLSALRSIGRGQLRAIPKAIAAGGLLRYGLQRPQASDRSAFEPTSDGIESQNEQKEVSDAAHAAGTRPDSGRESRIDAEDEIDVSDPAMADETAEATGPSSEQAQPSQTDSTEPEEDASDMNVDSESTGSDAGNASPIPDSDDEADNETAGER